MKKLLLVSTLLGLIVLGGCSNVNNTEQASISGDNLFEKRKECANLESNIKEQIINIKDDLQNKVGGRENTRRNIDQIFYSKKYDSCMYSVNVYGDIAKEFEVRFYDYFTREFLGTSATCTEFDKPGSQGECSHKQGEYESLMINLKGE